MPVTMNIRFFVNYPERVLRVNMNKPAKNLKTRQAMTALSICSMVLSLCGCTAHPRLRPVPPDSDIADILRLPQEITPYAARAGERLAIPDSCRASLLKEFRTRYFAPWLRTEPVYDPVEARDSMQKVARATWYGENMRRMPPKIMAEILDNCALDTFPSRSETAIAVAPAHLRGLPTHLPLFEARNGYPFDMLQYPHVKLNEPLRALHASRDGIWLYVETAISAGWLEARDVAFVDRDLIAAWMKRPLLTIVRDHATVDEAGCGSAYRVNIGTILPLAEEREGWWEIEVATAGTNRRAVIGRARIPRSVGARFPLPFDGENVSMIGDQLSGQPYGWGEMYDLRDCSAMVRDMFLPFGIWLPRTSADQIGSIPTRRDISNLSPGEKAAELVRYGRPFLTLFHKPGHVMLYLGTDENRQPLVFHAIWSLRVKEGSGQRRHLIATSAVTTLEPGRELGLAEGSSLLEEGTLFATITDRCSGTTTP